MRKLTIGLRKLLAPLLHPAEFIRYAANFDEWHRGRAHALRAPSATTGPSRGAAGTNPLTEFYLHGSHRGMTKPVHYLEGYLPHFMKLRERDPLRILEIGVFSGGSLELYRDFFAGRDLRIVGIDINEECRSFEAPGTSIVMGDQENRDFWRRFRGEHAAFDLIVDDGGHTCEQQIVTFEEMFGMVTPGGLYICEDMGGSSHGRFLAYMQGLLTPYNFTPNAPDAIHRSIRSVEFIPGCVLVTKRDDPAALQFRGPWIGTSWTAAATALYKQYNQGRSPPITPAP